MIRLASFIFFLASFSPGNCQDNNPSRKERKEISRIFEGETISEHVDLTQLKLSLEGFLKEGDQLFLIGQEGNVAGYMLRSRAMGRYDYFDYTVFYNPDLAIKGVIVTVYRSTHGVAICQKKWLGQFKGYEGGELLLGREIDAISGASISAQSMVEDIQRCFVLMTRLQAEGLIH